MPGYLHRLIQLLGFDEAEKQASERQRARRTGTKRRRQSQTRQTNILVRAVLDAKRKVGEVTRPHHRNGLSSRTQRGLVFMLGSAVTQRSYCQAGTINRKGTGSAFIASSIAFNTYFICITPSERWWDCCRQESPRSEAVASSDRTPSPSPASAPRASAAASPSRSPS